MTDSRFEVDSASARASWGWLALAAVLLSFSNGRWMIPAAAWWSPVFLLRFVRARRPLIGLPIGLALSMGVTAVIWKGLVPLQGAPYFAVTAVMGLAAFLPYLADRLLTPRMGGFSSTLVFPMASAALEFLVSVTSPYGSWGSVAYTQTDNLPLLQVVSVTGIPGLTFLVTWFASVVNRVWERRFEWARVQAGVLTYVATTSLVLVAGGGRIALAPPTARTVRVASLTYAPARPPALWRVGDGTVSDAEMGVMRHEASALLDSLLERSRREARAGARMVVWSEGSVACLKQDEPELIARAAELARREGVYLFVAVVTFTPGHALAENQLLALDPGGRLAFRYHKARPVPGDPETGADQQLPTLATPFGSVGAAICFDMDFPALIRQQGRTGADVLVVPSSDWKEIDPLHTRMALVRGVENGCSVVRQTAKGLSAAADYQGQLIATMDFFRAGDRTMVSQIPTRGVRTLYGRGGDVFAWACILGLALVAVMVTFQNAVGSLRRR